MQATTIAQENDEALIAALRETAGANDVESLFMSLEPTDPVEAFARRT